MKNYKNALSIRGDSLYCPLSFQLDSYWNCLIDCPHCFFRRLNHTWGKDLRPTDPEEVRKKLINGLKNKNPRSDLAWAIKRKKTLRFGNKSDPFQPVEQKYRVSRKLIKILYKLRWTFVLQTRCTDLMMEYESLLDRCHSRELLTVMPILSPGLEKDWEILERKLTSSPISRLRTCRNLIQKGIPVGINGEPFIPGFHEISDFEDTLKLLKEYGVESYNTYSFHFNAFVAKRLHEIGVDIEKIWYYNRDEYWKPILQKLIDLSIKYGIRLGNPDFVNTGTFWREQANTCCGINVPNPCTFNTHYFKAYRQDGVKEEEILEETYDGIGDQEIARKIVYGESCDMYTLKDAGFLF